MQTRMRAVVVQHFGGPEVLEVHRDVPVPQIKPNEVLIKVVAIGVNPVDSYIRAGMYSKLPPVPYIPGNDAAGTISKIGEKVTDFERGDSVVTFMNVRSGAYAEFCAVHTEWLVKLPRGYDFRKAAAIGTSYMTAYRALFQRANAKPGDSVLVHGASGGVGAAACQLASTHGLQVIGKSTSWC